MSKDVSKRAEEGGAREIGCTGAGAGSKRQEKPVNNRKEHDRQKRWKININSQSGEIPGEWKSGSSQARWGVGRAAAVVQVEMTRTGPG